MKKSYFSDNFYSLSKEDLKSYREQIYIIVCLINTFITHHDYLMKKLYNFFKSFIFISSWLLISNFLEKYWNIFHWEFVYLQGRFVFDSEFWFYLEKLLFGIDTGYYLEELFKFISYEIPKESFKYIPIYFFIRKIWTKNKK